MTASQRAFMRRNFAAHPVARTVCIGAQNQERYPVHWATLWQRPLPKSMTAISPTRRHYGATTSESSQPGKHGAGGARNYLADGDMSAGFALAAYPAEYAHGGVMTFIVNQSGEAPPACRRTTLTSHGSAYLSGLVGQPILAAPPFRRRKCGLGKRACADEVGAWLR